MNVWLTVAEASPILKMSQQAIYAAVRERQLPDAAVLRIGRRIRIDPTALSHVAIKGGSVDEVEPSADDREAHHAAR